MTQTGNARRKLRELASCEAGAIAPTTALALVALIAVGGLAFDYSRLVSLDTELQDAADHAALAAATQLDRADDQCARATAAASNLIANDSRFSKDGANTLVTIESVACNPDTRRVDVTVSAQAVDYALTPIVGLLSSNVQATAAASVGSAICKIPPLMMCNPNEGSANPVFDPDAERGKGIRLVGGGGSTWAPGNFGFLNVGADSVGVPDLREALAKADNSLFCINEDGVDTDPGLSATFANAFNTRFDIYDNGWASNNCYGNAACAGAPNATKDLMRPTGAASKNSCQLKKNTGWDLPPAGQRYLPTGTGLPYSGPTPAFMGHPRDICHAVSSAGTCPGGPIGNGVWDYTLYMKINHNYAGHPGDATAPPGPGATRFEVYQWELSNPGNRHARGVGGGKTHYQGNICSGGVTPSGPDRRITAMAIINCTEYGVNGHSTNVPVEEWADVFFVEPSVDRDRTSGAEIYIEIIGKTHTTGSGGTGGQLVRRDTPYLIE